MHAQNLVVDQCRNGQAVEAVSENFPQFDSVSALALVVKAVDTIDARTLVIASEQEEVFRELDLVGQKEANRLQGLLTTIDVIAEEEVVGIWREASVLEQAQQIIVLTMNIT